MPDKTTAKQLKKLKRYAIFEVFLLPFAVRVATTRFVLVADDKLNRA